MASLSAPLATTAVAPLRELEPWPITGGWPGGVARAAAKPLSELGQERREGRGLAVELIVVLLEERGYILLP